MKAYVGTKEEYRCNGVSVYTAKALSSPLYWASSSGTCRPGSNPQENNATGFSVVPNQYNNNYNGSLWAADLYYFYISSDMDATYTAGASNTSFYGIRCLRDNSNGENNTVNGPTVETIDSIRDITQNSAWIMGGTITDNGGMPITKFGVVVGTSASVTIPTATTTGNASYSPSIPYTMGGWNITGLSTNTQYYYRAYAINAIDTAYGEAIAFHTVEDGQPCPGLATVTDVEGNMYNTVMIGSQCWLKENLKVTKYADNTPLTMSSQDSDTEPYYKDPYKNAANGAGYLYNWAAVMNGAASSSADPSGVRGICPVGWHVPSDAEFTTLINYVKSKAEYLCNSGANNIAQALASAIGWTSNSTSCAPGVDPSNNNATGFSAVENTGSYADFWTATKTNYYLTYSSSTMGVYPGAAAEDFYGVRCVKDPGTTALSAKLPTVEIESVDDPIDPAYQKRVTATVTNDGGASITYRRVYYSKTPHPSPSNYTSFTSFTDSNPVDCIVKSNLEAGTTYYFRAAAQNSVGWAYSDEYSFTTDTAGGAGLKCPGTPSVTDRNSNSYATVQIGTQCWMAKNLRSTIYPGGGSITSYIPGTDEGASLSSNYGRLYTFEASMNGSEKVDNVTNIQGICPSGWHLPSVAEYNTLKSYLESQSDYQCSGTIAKGMASTYTPWTESSTACAPGEHSSGNNTSGFNAYPAGRFNGSTYPNYHLRAEFRTTTAPVFYLDYNYTDLYSVSLGSNIAVSVRCIKGATPPSVSTTNSATNIGAHTATVGGTLYTDGTNATFNASDVEEVGICYSYAYTTPTISNSPTVTATIAAGSFTVDLTDLMLGCKYYYRAYAKNANGVQYGKTYYFDTKKKATVNNVSYGSVTNTSVVLTGYITKNNSTITNWAFALYKQNPDGSYNDVNNYSKIKIDNTVNVQSGNYTITVTGLDSGATYKYRAWINQNIDGNDASWETASLSSSSFTTLSMPKVSMKSAAYSGSGTTFVYTGRIDAPGYPEYTQRGFVVGNSSIPEPTLEHCTYHAGPVSGTDSIFSKNDTWSSPNTVYYVRAYAKNSRGTKYSDVISFTTPSKPSVSFRDNYESPYNYSAHVGKYSIQLKTNATSTAPLTERGYIFTRNSSLEVPTSLPSETKYSASGSTWVKVKAASTSKGELELTIGDSLYSNTTYYIVAYAKNPFGTSFSPVTKTVKTKLVCSQTLTDQQGNTYGTISRGGKCWMTSNLRANKYDNVQNWSTEGTGTALTVTSSSNMSTTTRYAYYPNCNSCSSNVGSYGYLYNWSAATGYGLGASSSIVFRTNSVTSQGKIQGICPRGWHIPTSEELTTLRNYMSGYYTYFNSPAGKLLYTGTYSEFGTMLNLWSSTEGGGDYSWGTWIYPANQGCGDFTNDKKTGATVRCVQD